MLDISFYSTSGKPPMTIDVSEPFYEWLIHSDFTEIGVSRPHPIVLDDETVELDVVDLEKGHISNRQRFREFLLEVIAKEAGRMLQDLGDSPSHQSEVLDKLANGPVYLTQRSKPAAVLLSAALWDQLLNRLENQEDLIDSLKAELAIAQGQGEPEEIDFDALETAVAR